MYQGNQQCAPPVCDLSPRPPRLCPRSRVKCRSSFLSVNQCGPSLGSVQVSTVEVVPCLDLFAFVRGVGVVPLLSILCQIASFSSRQNPLSSLPCMPCSNPPCRMGSSPSCLVNFESSKYVNFGNFSNRICVGLSHSFMLNIHALWASTPCLALFCAVPSFFLVVFSSSSTPSSVPPVLHHRSCSTVASLLVGQNFLEDRFFLLRVFRVCPALFHVLPVFRLGVLAHVAHLHILFSRPRIV